MRSEMKTITVPAPRFDLYEAVSLYWDGQWETQVVRRWLDYDDQSGSWWYEVKRFEGKRFPESALEIAT
jgi:hypothetical protein